LEIRFDEIEEQGAPPLTTLGGGRDAFHLYRYSEREQLRARVRYPRSMADKASGMKSAYELALERMEKQGIEKPRTEGLGEEVQQKIAEARKQAEAKIAELEILHRDRLRKTLDPAKRQEEEDNYVRERRRFEDDCERKIAKLREG